MARELTAAGKTDDAVNSLVYALEVRPDDQQVAGALVKLLDAHNRYEEAEVIQRRFIANNRSHIGVLSALMSRLNRLWRFTEAIELGEKYFNSHRLDQRILLRLVRSYVEGYGVMHARDAIHRISKSFATPLSQLLAYTEVLECEGKFDNTHAVLLALSKDLAHDRFVHKESVRRLHRLQIMRTSQRVLDSCPLTEPIRGVLIIPDYAAPLAQLWQTPMAAELRKSGFATIALERRGCMLMRPCGISEIDQFQGILDAHRTRLSIEPEGPIKLRHNWNIDLHNEKIEVAGINLFQPIRARIGTKLRQYSFDWNHVLARALLHESLFRGDAALSICEQLKEVLASQGLVVRFLSGMSHFCPASVYRQYCATHGRAAGMEYVGIVAAYEHYYTNLKNPLSTAISVENLTRHPELTSPSGVTRSRFESWMDRIEDKRMALSAITDIIKIDRAGRVKTQQREEIHERIIRHKADAGHVVCLFGKIMYDIWMDEPRGPAHRDIVDWLNHSIESVKNSNTLLLIKPHPNEIKSHIARPNEFFYDLIQGDLNANVIVLDHKWFNMDEIVALIDLGVLWSGTSALELQASGVPAVVCSYWGLRDHPIPFFAPRSRGHYREVLRHPKTLTVSDQSRDVCALLVKYYSTEEVIIPHNFGVMPYQVGQNKDDICWNEEKVEEFILHGDPHVTSVARRIV